LASTLALVPIVQQDVPGRGAGVWPAAGPFNMFQDALGANRCQSLGDDIPLHGLHAQLVVQSA